MNTLASAKEQDIEKYLLAEVKAAGGIAEKVQTIGARGFFDRLVVLPGGRVVFAEVKKPRGGRLSQHQILRHETYRALGVEVAVLKTKSDVDALLNPVARLNSRA